MNVSQSDLKWRCRRGMLELDEMLNDFVDHGYEQLNEVDRLLFIELLDEKDQTLWRWFLAMEQRPSKYATLIDQIIDVYESHRH